MAKNTDKVRGSIFEIVLYPEDYPLTIISKVKKLSSLQNWAYITHDKDKYDRDIFDVNKPLLLLHSKGDDEYVHIHFLFRFKNVRYLESLAKEIGIPSYRIEVKNNWKESYKYLIHLTQHNEFKHLYSESDIFSNYHLSLNESQAITILADYILNFNGYLPKSVLLDYVLVNDLYSDYKRGYGICLGLLNEHNAKYIDNQF